MSNYITLALKNYAQIYKGIPANCWQSITFTCIQAIAIGICFFISIYFVKNLYFNVETAGVLMSCYGVGTILGGIIAGRLADKTSLSQLLIVMLFIQAASFILLTQLTSFISLAFNLFILGISSYGFKTSNDLFMLTQCYNDSALRLRVITISRASLNLGLGISGIIIGLSSAKNFQNIFSLFSLILFLTTMYLTLSSFSKKNIKKTPEEAKNTSIKILNTKKQDIIVVYVTLICLFFAGLMITQLSSTYPIYVHDAFPNLGMKAISILYMLDTILIIFFQTALTNAVSDYNKILISGFGAFLLGFGMVVLSFSYHFSLAILSCVIWTTGEMLFIPVAQLICYEKGSENKKGQTLGNFQAVYALSAVCGPIIGGYIYSHMGGNILWYLCGLLGLICLALCYYFKKYD